MTVRTPRKQAASHAPRMPVAVALAATVPSASALLVGLPEGALARVRRSFRERGGSFFADFDRREQEALACSFDEVADRIEAGHGRHELVAELRRRRDLVLSLLAR